MISAPQVFSGRGMLAALEAARLIGTAVFSLLPFVHLAIRVECPAAPEADGRLIDILREQLSRCGPANLARQCPPCHCIATSDAGWFTIFLAACLAALAGAADGWSLGRERQVEATAALGRGEQPGRPTRVVTPSSLKAIAPAGVRV